MDPKDLLDLYKESYYAELDRKENLTSNLSLPIGLAIVLVGAFLYYVEHFPLPPGGLAELPYRVWHLLFGVGLCSAAVHILLGAVYLARAWTGHEYVTLSPLARVERYHRELVEYFAENPEISPGAEPLFHHFLRQQIIEATDANKKVTDYRTWLRFRAHRCIIIATIFVMITVIPFVAIRLQEPAGKKTDHIELQCTETQP